MRVGIVTTWFERGAGVVSRQIADALSSAELEVYIYARGERYAVGDPKWDLPNVRWGKRLHWSGSGKIDRQDFVGWINQNALDAIIFNEQRWWQPIIWARSLGVKCGGYVDYYTEDTVGLFDLYDFLICNTKRHYSVFSWHSGARYVPWGTQVQTFKPTSHKNERFTFFHSAGWDPHRKGTDLVLKAFGRLRSELDADLLIHCQATVPDLGSDVPSVKVVRGTVPAPGLYHRGDVYVYPSRLEGIGLTICEALACGTPVITTNEPPMSEFVQEGSTGYLVPVAKHWRRSDAYYWPMAEVDVDALAAAMRRAYDMSRDDLEQMKCRARAYAEAERSWEKNAKDLSSIVKDAPIRTVAISARAAATKFDYSTLKGKIDYLLHVPPARMMLSGAFGAYRSWRQPDLYR